jgi:two-component system, chemotaxis family, CheB/CheR fusion protein
LTLVDISTVKHAENALFRERHLLMSLMDTVPDAIWFKDAQGHFVRVNEAFAQRVALPSPADAVGRSLAELVDDAEEVRRTDEEERRVLQSGEPILDRLEEIAWPDGRREWMLTSRLALRDPEGNVVGTLGVSRDVTRQKHAEDRAQDAVRRRDEFLAMLSHELRNPLGAVQNALELLDKAHGEPRRLQRVIRRQTNQMARLLDDLLDVSRVTRDKIELQLETLDLRVLVSGAVEAVHGSLESRSQLVSIEDDGAPLWVNGDAARLQQVLVNLLTNASRYSPEGSPMHLTLRRADETVVLSVRDEGRGIEADMLEQIFEPFVQAEQSYSRSNGGMGLGLTLVRALVAKHHGTVQALSDGLGTGAEFVVRLPAVSAPTASSPRRRHEVPPPVDGVEVLLVEDGDDNRELLCELLATMGCTVRVATDGLEALEAIAERRPQLALIDIGLPRMDGYGVARLVQSQWPERSWLLVALTGYGQNEDRRAALAAGFDEHLVKPVSEQDLRRMLHLAAAGRPIETADAPQ